MWKKLENYAGSRLESSSNQGSDTSHSPDYNAESVDDRLLQAIRKDERDEREDQQFEDVPQPEVSAPQAEAAEPQPQKASPETLGAYTDAVKKFTRSASAFIEHLPLLAEAREAYEEASRASTELRKVLDSGDENLRTLMAHLEQMANVHLVNVPVVKSISDRKKPEPSKLAPVRGNEEFKGGLKRFP